MQEEIVFVFDWDFLQILERFLLTLEFVWYCHPLQKQNIHSK